MMALFNRGLLRQNTGDLRGAIADYTTVINEFPNFWTGLEQRAQCYRLLGQTAAAERDEFRVYKAQMDKHLGIQPRWTEEQVRETRKRSEHDPSKYASIVVDDSSNDQEYQSEYRGRIQNRKVAFTYQPMIEDNGERELSEAERAYNSAMFHVVVNEKEQAVMELSNAIELDPAFAEAYYNRGMIYYHIGDKDSATRDLSKAGELGLPDAYSVMKQIK